MEFNWIGLAFVSDELPDSERIQQEVDDKAEELKVAAKDQFYDWLEQRGLDMVMGVIVEKEPDAEQAATPQQKPTLPKRKPTIAKHVCRCKRDTGTCRYYRSGQSSQGAQYTSCNKTGEFLTYHDLHHPEFDQRDTESKCDDFALIG